jgi:serine/threonine protein kinase
MGIVCEDEQESLNRHVAIKVLAPGPALSPQIVERFFCEAKAAAQLHHTNIVPVYSVGERDGLHFYTMQFIRGISLDKVLKEVRRLKERPPDDPGDVLGISHLRFRLTLPDESDGLARLQSHRSTDADTPS